MALEKELAAFHRELPNLLKDTGRFALVHDDAVHSTWAAWEDAIQEGYRSFGFTPFLVKQIQLVEPVIEFERDILPLCRS